MNARGQFGLLLIGLVFLGVLGFFAVNLHFGSTYDGGVVGSGTNHSVGSPTALVPSTSEPALFWIVIFPLAVAFFAIVLYVVIP